jgi:hypothetical protein
MGFIHGSAVSKMRKRSMPSWSRYERRQHWIQGGSPVSVSAPNSLRSLRSRASVDELDCARSVGCTPWKKVAWWITRSERVRESAAAANDSC